jgi:hypothetical protein
LQIWSLHVNATTSHPTSSRKITGKHAAYVCVYVTNTFFHHPFLNLSLIS